MIKDALGNDLKVGDLVALQLDRPLIFGRITEIRDGGMIVAIKGGQPPEVRPTQIQVASNHTIQADPRMPVVGALMCIREDHPTPEAAAMRKELDQEQIEKAN